MKSGVRIVDRARRGIVAFLALGLIASLPGVAVAEPVVITAFTPRGRLAFQTPTGSSLQNLYRIEQTRSLINPQWRTLTTILGAEADDIINTHISGEDDRMFYRVVSSLNSAAFVDGDYISIDVSRGPTAKSYPVHTYSGAGALPGGISAKNYKESRILLRYIPGGAFIMGPWSDEANQFDGPKHSVTLSRGFYISVYQITQAQWERVMGTWPGWFSNQDHRASRPVEQVSYTDIRGALQSNGDPAGWPESTDVGADSFLGKLREKTGLALLDLPTEAQWEYACRAGTTTDLNSGADLSVDSFGAELNELARHALNSQGIASENSDTSAGTATVGTYAPNAFGLYDTHGNVYEWCLDWMGAYEDNAVDPVGYRVGYFRIIRGGAWNSASAWHCRSFSRSSAAPDSSGNHIGFRLAIHSAVD